MRNVAATIEKTIKEPVKKYSFAEAQAVLKKCGILNQNNNIKKAYKDILVKVDDVNNA